MSEVWQTDADLRLRYGDAYEQMRFEEMKRKKPRAFTEKAQSFCPCCNNPQTLIPRGNLIKELTKGYVKVVLAIIHKHNLQDFTLSQIRNILNEDITDGTLQNKALIVLSILGYINKEIEEFTDKKGKEKIKYKYHLNKESNPKKCLNKINKHEKPENLLWRVKRLNLNRND